MTAKIISIETRRCCDCGKPLPKESETIHDESDTDSLFELLDHPCPPELIHRFQMSQRIIQ
jgi:hypothetical protein